MFIKKYRRLLAWCLIFVIFSFTTYSVDSRLVAHDKSPIFVIPSSVAKDGGTTIYSGLGYKVIGWNKAAVKQIDGKEVTGTMTGYEISTIFNSQDINEGPKKELKFISSK